MVKISNAEVLNCLRGLNELTRVYLPVRGALKVRRIYKSLEASWEIVEDVRKQLFEKYALKDEKGNPVVENTSVKIAPEHEAQFQESWQHLLAEEVEVPETLSQEDFGDEIQIKPETLFTLGKLIQD